MFNLIRLLSYFTLARHVVIPLFLLAILSLAKVFYIGLNLLLLPSVFDRLFISFDVLVLIKIVFLSIALMIFHILIDVIMETLVAHVQYKLSMKVKMELLGRAFRFPFAFFSKTSSGELSKLIIRDTDMVTFGLREVVNFAINGFQMILMGVGAYYISPWYFKVYVILCSVVLAWNFLWRPFYNKIVQTNSDESTNAYGFLWSAMGTFRDIKILGLEKRRLKQFDDIQNRQKKYLIRNDFFTYWLSLLNQPVGSIGFAVCLYILLLEVQQGRASLGMLAAFTSIIYLLLNPVLYMVVGFAGLEMGIVGAKLLKDFKSTSKEKTGKQKWSGINQGISIKNLNFGYTPDRQILHDISLEIPAGAHVGIVGQTGCGKSTLLNLLLKIYAGYTGQISVDGKDISEVENDSLRDAINYLGQDSICFLGTIRDNVDPKKKLKDTEIIEACKRAQLGGVLDRFNGGIYEEVNDGSLSGGERQRLFLARSIAKQGDLLVFDEATSALDPYTEKLVLDTLQELRKGRTSISVAHRLSNIKNCDIIYVLDEGRVVEQGTYQELVALKGSFYNLFQEQQN